MDLALANEVYRKNQRSGDARAPSAATALLDGRESEKTGKVSGATKLSLSGFVLYFILGGQPLALADIAAWKRISASKLTRQFGAIS